MRKTICILLLLCMLLSCSPVAVLAEDAGIAGPETEETAAADREPVGGTCGPALTWTLDDAGVLTISGTGEMDDYYYSIFTEGYDTPWYDLRDSITSVVIGPGVTVIGQCAFAACKNLTGVSIPDSVTVIRRAVFYKCTSLEAVVLPDTLTTLGESVFSDCSSLKTLLIPEGVTEIGDNLFRRCTSLTEISIPDSAGSIGMAAFTDCSGLEQVHIGSGVTQIGRQAFFNCVSLTTVSGMDGVVSIGDHAFCNCVSLSQITVPAGVTSVGTQAFYNCDALADENGFVIITDVLYDYVGSDTDLVIPDGVTAVDSYVFTGNSTLESVVLPDSVSSIGSGAFRNCSKLKQIDMGDGVTWVGIETFRDCISLKSVSIPESLTIIYRSAFSGCSALEAVHITDLSAWCGITFYTDAGDYDDFTCNPLYCAKHLYLNGDLITDLVIPTDVTAIGEAAFVNGSDLVSVAFPESVTAIGDSAFRGCMGLSSLTVPGNVAAIGEGAFFGCTGLKKAVLGYGVEYLGYESFSCCQNLKSIVLPDSITVIEDEAFYACRNLSSVTLPAGLTEICPYTFINCSKLASVTIPDGVNSIGTLAFSSCESLTELTIPASVTSISGGAFHNCTGLTDIWFCGDAPSISGNSFKLVVATAHYPQNAHWPKSLRKNYGGTLTWKAYIPAPELRIGGMSASGVRLEWNAVDGAEKYQIQRKTGSGTWSSLKTVKSAGFTDASAQMGETYRYRVRAYVNGTWSEYSSPVKTRFNPFTDVSMDEEQAQYIAWAYNNSVVKGDGSGHFNPDDPCTRMNFVMILWKMHGKPTVSGSNPFTDVSGTTSVSAVKWAVKKKLVTGTSATTFSPDDNLSRINIIMILYKLAGSPKASADSPYEDISGSKTSKAVNWAVSKGIISSLDETHFGPSDECSRALLVEILCKYNNLYHVI